FCLRVSSFDPLALVILDVLFHTITLTFSRLANNIVTPMSFVLSCKTCINHSLDYGFQTSLHMRHNHYNKLDVLLLLQGISFALGKWIPLDKYPDITNNSYTVERKWKNDLYQ